jgi:type IV fimbrial biogenesis protein FimT
MVELLVTIMVIGILLALAIPAFRTFLQNDRQWTQESSLVLAFNAARSEAIKQDVAGGVQVCASADGATCSGGNWATGWIVLSSASATPIQSVGALPTGTTLTELNGNVSVTYHSNGMLNSALLVVPGAPPAFTMCDTRGVAQARYAQVTLAGQVLSSNTPGQNLSGANLTSC